MKTRPQAYGDGYTGHINSWVFGPSNPGGKCSCGWYILDKDFTAGRCLNCDKEFK